jgi:hypothetical protein
VVVSANLFGTPAAVYEGNVKFIAEMPDFGVNPITKRAYSSQISRDHKIEAMKISYSRTGQDTDGA